MRLMFQRLIQGLRESPKRIPAVHLTNSNSNTIWCTRKQIKVGSKRRTIVYPAIHKSRKALKQIARLIAVHLPVYDVICTSTPGSSFISNAARHTGAVNILNVDIKNFYPSCRPSHIERAILEYPISKELEEVVKECMFDTGLPVGFNTSPAISNYLMYPIDRDLYQSIKMIDSTLTITRYFDDITVSSDRELFQSERDLIFAVIQKTLIDTGFEINTSKSKWLRPGVDLQAITGLSLHTGVPSVPNRRIKEDMRPVLDRLACYYGSTSDTKTFMHFVHRVSEAAGYLSYLKQTNLLQYIKMLSYLEKRIQVHQGKQPNSEKILEYIRHERASCQQSDPSS